MFTHCVLSFSKLIPRCFNVFKLIDDGELSCSCFELLAWVWVERRLFGCAKPLLGECFVTVLYGEMLSHSLNLFYYLLLFKCLRALSFSFYFKCCKSFKVSFLVFC